MNDDVRYTTYRSVCEQIADQRVVDLADCRDVKQAIVATELRVAHNLCEFARAQGMVDARGTFKIDWTCRATALAYRVPPGESPRKFWQHVQLHAEAGRVPSDILWLVSNLG